MILYKVNKSPFEHQAIHQCLDRMTVQDSLLLTESACYAVTGQGISKQRLEELTNLYVIQDDLKARGLTCDLTNCQQISYNDMVELCLRHTQVISW